jgi:Lon protease-like protein
MNDDLSALGTFDGSVRLFPIPNLVAFPHVVQGLHIFEPRYRQLMTDSLAGNRLFALAVLMSSPDSDDDELPPLEPIACLGRIGAYEQLPDGRYNLHFHGLSRIRLLHEVDSGKKYRTALAELVPERGPSDIAELAAKRRRLAEAVLARFDESTSAFAQLRDLFASEASLGQVCDMLGYALPMTTALKYQLLAEPDIGERTEILYHALTAKPRPARKFPPEFSAN